MIDRISIINILTELSELYDYWILTGSCSDMFNIGYNDIEDIDIIVEANNFYAIDLPKEKFNLIYSLKHKKDSHLLNRYLYNSIQIDILVKTLLQTDISTVDIDLGNNNKIKSCDINTRYLQLINHNYKESFSNYDIKIKKVQERILKYKNLLFADSRD
jgi:hypothetical protein